MRFLGKKTAKHFILLFIFVGIFCFWFLKNNDDYIDEILKTEDYSYLPNEAKEYIKEVYEESESVVLTEKNKIEEQPYLNPEYVEYLKLSEEEKNEVDLAPDTFVIDYNPTITYSENNSLPRAYDLRSVDGHNYLTAIKDQGTLGVCWAISAIENVETLIMKQSQSETVENFSVRQLDYATSNNKLASYIETAGCGNMCSFELYENRKNASRELGSGGNFYTAAIAMANAVTLTDETTLPWNENDDLKLASEIMGTDKTLYEANSLIIMPTINADSASDELTDSYVEQIKNYILQYGGPSIGTYSPNSTCGFINADGNKVIKTDSCVNDDANSVSGHAMQIIGWSDGYEYSYCENGTKHSAVSGSAVLGNITCDTGELVEGRGVWLLRNSWGETDQYVYLTYDSTRLAIGFVTSVSKMSERTWDNNYHDNPWINQQITSGMASVITQQKTFNTNNSKNEKIEKIKLFTASLNGSYNISIISGNTNYNNIATLNSDEVGIYTIDLSDKNIIVDSSFTVRIIGNNESLFFRDSMSIFTSNVDENEYVVAYSSKAQNPSTPLSTNNPARVFNNNGFWELNLSEYLKNIPETASLTYHLAKDGVIISVFSSEKVSITPELTSAQFKDPIDGKIGSTWTFEILYDDNIVLSFPVEFLSGITIPPGMVSSNTGAIVLAYGNNLTSAINQITTSGTKIIEHYNKSDQLIDSETLKTGDKIRIIVSGAENVKYDVVIRGDVDGDGEIGIIDYIRIKKDIMDMSKLNGIYYEAADMNQNNSIDIIDYIRIKKIIMEDK